MALPYLFQAALHRHFDGVRSEIEKGVDVNQQYHRQGILHLLPYSGNFGRAGGGSPAGATYKSAIELLANECAELYRMLIAAGADVNARDGWERNALYLPCMYADTLGPRGFKFGKIVDVLMDAGSDPNAADRWGHTPARAAILSKDLDVVERVFTNEIGVEDIQADVNLQTGRRGLTPFIVSVRSGQLDIVEFLLTLNPDVSIRTHWDNKTGKDFALDMNRQDIVDAIELFGEMTMPDGDTIPEADPLTVTTEDQ